MVDFIRRRGGRQEANEIRRRGEADPQGSSESDLVISVDLDASRSSEIHQNVRISHRE